MAFERTKKWENELNICIRCSYCFEHCHLQRVFNLHETDSPRGKLVLAYGLLAGDIKPTQYIAEKIFECFYCKCCENACPAKVKVTEIFTDIRQDLADEGFIPDGVSAIVNEDLCGGCGVCSQVCKSEAITIKKKEEKRVAEVDKVKCKGCGLCSSICPSKAITQREGFAITRNELTSTIKKYLGG